MRTIITPKPTALINIQAACAGKTGHARTNCIRRSLAALTVDALIYMIETLNERTDDFELQAKQWASNGFPESEG